MNSNCFVNRNRKVVESMFDIGIALCRVSQYREGHEVAWWGSPVKQEIAGKYVEVIIDSALVIMMCRQHSRKLLVSEVNLCRH